MESVYTAPFADWEENPKRYMVENPRSNDFEKAVELISYTIENRDKPYYLGCIATQ